MKPNTEAVAVAEAEVARTVAIARREFGVDLGVLPVRWDIRGFSMSGACRYERAGPVIRLNAAVANGEGANYRPTVGHEVAHAVAVAKWGRVALGHGLHWIEVMEAFDLPPLRYSSYATSQQMREASRVKRGGAVLACCGCGSRLSLTPGQVAAINAGRARYSCAKCGTSIALTPR